MAVVVRSSRCRPRAGLRPPAVVGAAPVPLTSWGPLAGIVFDMASMSPAPAPVPHDDLGGAQRAYELLRTAIIEGRYRPGQRLVEQRIGEELALSRTPVREALRRLEAEGLVLSRRNRGAVVRPVDAKEVVDLYELRARLESLAAERAAERVTPADVAELDAAIAEFDDALAGSGSAPRPAASDLEAVRALNRANARFHDAVLRAADHVRLANLLARTVDIPLVFQAFRVFTPGERARSNLFHRLVRDAVAAAEPARAGRLMTEHVLLGRDSLLSRMAGTSGDWPAALRDRLPATG